MTEIESGVLDRLSRRNFAFDHFILDEETARGARYTYRSMLRCAHRAGIELASDLSQRDWPAIVSAYLNEKAACRASTLLTRLSEIEMILPRFGREIDLSFLEAYNKALHKRATQERTPIDIGELDAIILLRAALALCEDAMRRFHDLERLAQAYMTPEAMLERFRDGLILALMALLPLRVGNFSRLVLEAQFKSLDDGFSIEIEQSNTKNQKRILSAVPAALTPLVRFYLEVARPRLCSVDSTALWPNAKGVSLSLSWFQRKLPDLIEELTGQRIRVHAVRAAAASTARAINRDPDVGRILLAHRSRATTEHFYGKASDAAGRAIMSKIAATALA